MVHLDERFDNDRHDLWTTQKSIHRLQTRTLKPSYRFHPPFEHVPKLHIYPPFLDYNTKN